MDVCVCVFVCTHAYCGGVMGTGWTCCFCRATAEENALARIRELKAAADHPTAFGESGATKISQLHNQLRALQAQLMKGPDVSARVWEELGRAFSELADYDNAIIAYKCGAGAGACAQVAHAARAPTPAGRARAGSPRGLPRRRQTLRAGP